MEPQSAVDRSGRVLKKSASGVLTSLRGSTYRSVRLPSSLAAALLDGLFEHPAKLRLLLAPKTCNTRASLRCCFGHSSPLPTAAVAAQQERLPNGALITLREPPSPGPK